MHLQNNLLTFERMYMCRLMCAITHHTFRKELFFAPCLCTHTQTSSTTTPIQTHTPHTSKETLYAIIKTLQQDIKENIFLAIEIVTKSAATNRTARHSKAKFYAMHLSIFMHVGCMALSSQPKMIHIF